MDHKYTITLSGELIESLAQTDGEHSIYLVRREKEGVYNYLRELRTLWDVPGTLYVKQQQDDISAESFGSTEDIVRLVYTSKTDRMKSEQNSSQVKGYVHVHGAWIEAVVYVIPVKKELFSRINGLLETDILADKRVFKIGLGSGGIEDVLELAKSAIGHFDVMDHDVLEVANVARHHAGLDHVGRLKVNYAEEAILNINPYATVRKWPQKVCWDNLDLLRSLIRDNDIVVCGTDSRESRIIINKLCILENKPCVFSAAFERAYGGQVLLTIPGKTPCYQCFLDSLPDDDKNREISNQETAERIAYADHPVPIETGLSIDIKQISLMTAKLVDQFLLRGKSTTLRSLDEDLVAPLYFFLNRRQPGTEYEKLEPLAFNINGLRILSWYGLDFSRNPDCCACGKYVEVRSAKLGVEITDSDLEEMQQLMGA